MTERFTTEDTGHPADWWYQPADGPKLYWTHEEWEAMMHRNDRARIKERAQESIPLVKERLDNRKREFQLKRRKEVSNDMRATCVVCQASYIKTRRTRASKTCSPQCSITLARQTDERRNAKKREKRIQKKNV